MSDQEINIAIAEACGWEWRVGIYGNCRGLFHPDDKYLKHYKCTEEQMIELPISSDCACRVPNYCNDLNAMHEAENWMIANKSLMNFWKYADTLKRHFSNLGDDGCIHATARQRAEAFLRMIGKWKESAE